MHFLHEKVKATGKFGSKFEKDIKGIGEIKSSLTRGII
jgi:hypothetical protein